MRALTASSRTVRAEHIVQRRPISFRSEAAANLFRRDLILSAVDGIENEASTGASEWLPSFYEFAARLHDLLAAHDGDSRDLAVDIARAARHHWCPPAQVGPEQAS